MRLHLDDAASKLRADLNGSHGRLEAKTNVARPASELPLLCKELLVTRKHNGLALERLLSLH